MEAIDIPEKRRSDPTCYDAAFPNKIDWGNFGRVASFPAEDAGLRVEGEHRMRTMTAACLAAAMMLMSHPESAKAGAWCAWYDAYTYNCGFRTLEQCRATVFGDSGAYCAPNPANGYGEPRSRAKTYPGR